MTPEALLELFILSPVGIVDLDVDGRVLGANVSARRLLGPITRDGSLDALFADLGALAPALPLALQTAAPPRGVVIDQVELYPPEGPHGLLLSLVRLDPRQHVLLVTEASSVASARATIEQLTQQQTLTEQAVRDHAVYTLDRDGRVSRWSAAAERIYQHPAADIRGRGTAELLAVTPADTAAAYARETLELAARNGWCEEEGERRRADGTTFWGSTVTSALRSAAGTVIGFQVVTQDRTDRRRGTDSGSSDDPESGAALAGVLGRRTFFDRSTAEVARARRYAHALTLLLIDPDDAASLQQQRGEGFLEEWHRVIASIIGEESRASDLVGRVGGEGFGVLLPSTERSGGLVLAERIRERMQRHAFGQAHRGVRATLSIGVAEVCDTVATVDDLFQAAGTAVERARQAGRNLVVGYDP